MSSTLQPASHCSNRTPQATTPKRNLPRPGVSQQPAWLVMWAFPWGEPGTPLEKEEGPDEWQRLFLQDLAKLLSEREFDCVNPVNPIQMSVASGHGIGKSALIAWLHGWIMCTRPNSKGGVTDATGNHHVG